MNLAAPAPTVETAVAEPAARSSAVHGVEPARAVETVEVEPASRDEAVDDAATTRNAQNSSSNSNNKLSVSALRNMGNVDFEGRVGVCRGGAPKKSFLKKMLPLFFDHRDFITYSEIARYVVIRQGTCFVFMDSTDPAPLYAFDLRDMTATKEDPQNPDKASCTVNPSMNTNQSDLATILLHSKTGNRELKYQFTFDKDANGGQKEQVKKFIEAVERLNVQQIQQEQKGQTQLAQKQRKS